MIGRRAILGLSLLSALLFCALGAQSAWAVKSINTTAVTCQKTALEEGGFSDAHCDDVDPTLEGKFEHAEIPTGMTTSIAVTNGKVTEATQKSEPADFYRQYWRTRNLHQLAKVKNDTTKSFIHNLTSDKNHTVTGEVKLEFSDCKVVVPVKCTVKEPILGEATFEGVEELGTEKNEMGQEFKGKGAEETWGEITFEGGECALKGEAFKLKGSAIATSEPGTESAQTNQFAGVDIGVHR